MDGLEKKPEGMAEEASESEVFPMSLAGGRDLKPRDVVRIKVTAVNEDGTFSGEPVESSEDEEGEPVTIDKMTNDLAAFDKEGA